ncbi:MAG TPA: DUF4190 domain-containing protein [Mycobacterium sp.]
MTNPDQPFQPPEGTPNVPPPGYPGPPVDYPQYPAGYPAPPPYPGGPPPYPGGPPPYPSPPFGYPQGPGGYDPYGRPLVAGTNGLAVGSLVCSVAGLLCGLSAIAGVILGAIAMQQTKRTGQQGYALALTGVITGAVLLLLWLGFLAVAVR